MCNVHILLNLKSQSLKSTKRSHDRPVEASWDSPEGTCTEWLTVEMVQLLSTGRLAN